MSFLLAINSVLSHEKDDRLKLFSLTNCWSADRSQHKNIQWHEITPILRQFSNDCYKIDVLKLIINDDMYAKENNLLDIRRTFSTGVYDMKIISIFAPILDVGEACDIIGRFKKNIYQDEFKCSYVLNGIKFRGNIKIKIHDVETSVEITGKIINIAYGPHMSSYNYNNNNQMEITISKTEPFISVKNGKNDKNDKNDNPN